MASKHGRLDVMKFLVSREECDLNIQDKNGNTPLHHACHLKELNVVQVLLENKFSTNILNMKRETAQKIPLNRNGDCLLHIACQWGDAAIVKYLITDQRCRDVG